MDPTLAQRAGYYAVRGWLPVPVKSGDKAPPAEGFTGSKSPDPTYDQWEDYVEANPGYGNLAIRLPLGVVGIDIDGYKPEGADTYSKIKDWLIPTVVVSARMALDDDTDWIYDGISGIYLYRSRLDQGGLPGVDLIRNGHRYILAPGSIHPSGRPYQALDRRTGEMDLPRVDDLPELPRGLEQMMKASATPKVASGHHDLASTTLIRGAEPCNYNLQMLKRFERIDLSGPSGGELPTSRHDEMMKVTRAVVMGIGDGHRGAHTVLQRMVDQAAAQNEARVTEVKRLIGTRFPHEITGPHDPCPNCDDTTFGLAPTQPPARAPQVSQVIEVEVPPTGAGTRDWLIWCQETGAKIGHGPWALVGSVLAFAAAQISPYVTIDVGLGPMSLNTYVMLVGGPSSGKSLAINTVSNSKIWDVDAYGLGTGEGVAAHFGYPVETKDEETGQKRRTIERHRYRALLVEDEWGRQVDKAKGNGGTLMAVLRTAWTGGALGQANRDPKTAIPIAKQSYRLSIIAGAQPSVAMDVLGTHAAILGTPQRFLVFEATKTHRTALDTIDNLPIKFPPGLDSEANPYRMTIVDEAIAAWSVIHETEVLEGDVIGEHRGTRVLKVAAVVALMEGRTEVSMDDWILAERLVTHSDNAVRRIASRAAEQAREAKVAAVAADLEVQTSAQAASDAKRVEAFVAKAGAEGVTRGKIERALWKSALRSERSGPAIDAAVARGLVVAVEAPQADGSPGHRYFPPSSR